MGFRRVITSMTPEGRSVVLADEQVESIDAGASIMNQLWRSDESPTVPNDGAISPAMSFPEPPGVWVFTWTVAPGASAESEEAGDLVGVDLSSEEGYQHATDTVDVNYLLAGKLVLDLDGTKVEVNQGDVVVMNGASHAWTNPGTEVATMLSTVVGATRIPPSG